MTGVTILGVIASFFFTCRDFYIVITDNQAMPFSGFLIAIFFIFVVNFTWYIILYACLPRLVLEGIGKLFKLDRK